MQAREVLGRRVGVGAQNPVRALEQVSAGALDAIFLGAGHGVARHVIMRIRKRFGGHADDAAFRGRRVGDDAAVAPLGQVFQIAFHHADGRCQNHQVAAVFDKRAELGGVGRRRGGCPAAADSLAARGHVGVHGKQLRLGARLAQRGGEASADQPEADDGNLVKARASVVFSLLCHVAIEAFQIRSRVGRSSTRRQAPKTRMASQKRPADHCNANAAHTPSTQRTTSMATRFASVT